MSLSRREMLLAGLGLLISGCSTTHSNYARRPRTQWPDAFSRPRTQAGVSVLPPTTTPAPAPAAPAQTGLAAIPRARWTRAHAIGGRVNPMGAISRITVHHEGWKTVWFTDEATTAARLEQVRATHVGNRGWGDIGYHYIIDRAGRVWEGRDIRYQGAHVSQNNEHNIGVMCLGNFEEQRPSDAQLQALTRTLQSLTRTYRVPSSRVYTHRELNPTACPGRYLQPRVVALRSGGYLA